MTDLWNRSGESPRKGDVHPKSGARARSVSRGLLTGVLAVTLMLAPSISFAGDDAAEVSRESGLGAAAAISSLVYAPGKLVYAVGGLVVGSFAWAFTAGDTQVASKVFTRSLRGTYVITPEILLGEERLEFIGRDSAVRTPGRNAAVASVSPQTTSKAATYEEPEYDEMGW
jgi:hypothetical protein